MRALTSDKRLNTFLEAQYQHLGVLRVHANDSGAEEMLKRRNCSFQRDVLSILLAAHQLEVEVFEYHSPKYAALCWLAQWLEGSGDDATFTLTVWGRKPSSFDIIDYLVARKIEIDVDLGVLSPLFHCWECGRQVHVLDCSEVRTLDNVLQAMQERYCGCQV